MRTDITVLDKLTGFDKPQPSSDGHIWLLRGPPGSGKTTLALQILAKYLANRRGCGGFISLEVEPERSLKLIQRKFPELDLLSFDGGTGKASQNFSDHGEHYQPGLLVSMGRWELEEAIRHGPWTQVSRHLTFFKEHFQGKTNLLIIIDSINVLADIVRTKAQAKAGFFDLRMALSNLCQKIKEDLGSANVILTSEYHPTELVQAEALPESFSCDIEILLQNETLAADALRTSGVSGGVGYSVDRLARETQGKRPQSVESRSFCRVMKSRDTPCQARRCAYDIIPGKGVTFFETYPGDGHVLLFAENVAQRNAWDEFFKTDVPHLYPALRHERFDRSALQRTFATQRRFKNVPEKTDMFLTSFDSYWIKWYTDLQRHWQVYHQARVAFPELQELSAFAADAHKCIEDVMRKRSADSPDAGEDLVELLMRQTERLGLSYWLPSNKVQEIIATQQSPLDSSLLHPLPKAELKLFGGRSSRLVEPLRKSRPDFLGDSWLSVPYDANIGFVVYRKDLLAKAVSDLSLATFRDDIGRFYSDQKSAVRHFERCSEEATAVAYFPNPHQRIPHLYERLKQGEPPCTWEEIWVLCKNEPQAFLIDTKIYDSYLCTLLELVWAFGGEDIVLGPDYRFQPDERSAGRCLFQALFLMWRFFKQGIIPYNSNLDPAVFGELFSIKQGDGNKSDGGWMFARHWYSTFVDILTSKKPPDETDFLWNPADETTLGVMPIPTSLCKMVTSATPPKHISCWGEWHLALLKGSENEALAIDLINNLMSAQKICERAFSCAALPTVEEFYEMYGDVKCFNVPGRPSHLVPEITFQQLRDTLFSDAKSRNEIFDFAHCGRELHAVLDFTHHASQQAAYSDDQQFAEALTTKVRKAITRIRSFAERELLAP